MIEILIVVVILGILATLGLANFFPSLEKARDARRKSDLSNIAKALEAFHTDYGKYPNSNNNAIVGCNSGGSLSPCVWGQPFTDTKGTVYMAILPADPRATAYKYRTVDDGESFALYARMENNRDSAVPEVGGVAGVYQNIECGGLYCNIALTSPGDTTSLAPVVSDPGPVTGPEPLPE